MIPLTENQIQGQITEMLTVLGFQVFQASRRGVKTKDGTRVFGADGCSRGLPDIFVRHPSWPRGMQLGIEVKKAKRWEWTTNKQREAWESGATAKVHSLDQALATVFVFWRDLKNLELPERLWTLQREITARRVAHGFCAEL